MRLPIIIDSDEDYAIAVERIEKLEFDPGNPEGGKELVAITEAMLKWELRSNLQADDE